MDDDLPSTFRLRLWELAARCFGILASLPHAEDEIDAREIGERHAHWILTGEFPNMDNPEAEAMAQKCYDAARSAKPDKRG